jgi:hypothetical protein
MIRDALVAYHRRFCERWPTAGACDRLARIEEAKEDCLVDSTTLFCALHAIDERTALAYQRPATVPPRWFVLGHNNVLREAAPSRTGEA